jgi:hypothetical protein
MCSGHTFCTPCFLGGPTHAHSRTEITCPVCRRTSDAVTEFERTLPSGGENLRLTVRRHIRLANTCLACDTRLASSLAAFLSTRGCAHLACHEHLPVLPQTQCQTCAATVDIFFGSSPNNVCQICFEIVGDKIAIPDAWYDLLFFFIVG